MIIRDLIGQRPAAAIAFKAEKRHPLTYGQLLDLIDKTSAALAARSIGTADKLAIVLPNGPEMAAAFIAAASSCVTAPLNPAYRHDEFAFYLDDLKARALRLRDFAGSRLADFKVPRRILIVPEIPKGATGKLQRMGLAQKLGLVS